MFIGSAFSPAFLPASSAILDRSLCGWSSSSAPILLVRLSVSFPISSSGYSFNTLDYSDDNLLVLSWRCLSHAHPPLAITSAQVAVRMMWCDAKTRRAAPHYLPRQKALINHRNSLEYTQEHIHWLLKCLHYNTKLLYGQKKHYNGRKACVAMVMTGVLKIRPKRNILHLFHRPTNGFLLFSAKWTGLWNQTFRPSERNERSEFLNWPTDYTNLTKVVWVDARLVASAAMHMMTRSVPASQLIWRSTCTTRHEHSFWARASRIR